MTTLPRARFANLSFVTPRLAVGGDLDSLDRPLALMQLVELVHLGVTHVVDVRSEWSDAELFVHQAPQVRYLHHGMDDAGQSVPLEWFEHAVSWVEAAWAQDPGAVVLSHCHMGINRGWSLGFAVLLAQGWDPVGGIAALRAARPQANAWYAADALDWHQARTGVGDTRAAEQHAALAAGGRRTRSTSSGSSARSARRSAAGGSRPFVSEFPPGSPADSGHRRRPATSPAIQTADLQSPPPRPARPCRRAAPQRRHHDHDARPGPRLRPDAPGGTFARRRPRALRRGGRHRE